MQDMLRANPILARALELPAGEAESFVRQACAGDSGLCDRVLRLLRLAGSEQVNSTLGALFGSATSIALGAIAPAAPERVGAWRLLELLGSGGMAQVFRAERDDGTVAQQAAVKILWPHQLRPDYISRFAREREILATLDDPRIARYLDGGVADDGRPWLAVELVEGSALDQYLMQPELRLPARLDLFTEIAGAVASAHRQMVVHRDLKPANVLVRRDGAPRLLDFGIAALLSSGNDDHLTRDHGRLLTPAFASPEQLSGTRVDARSDVFQLGAILHLLLTGSHPFSGPNGGDGGDSTTREPRLASSCVRADTGWPISARSLRGDLDAIVLKAIDRDPEARYQSVDALLDDLRRTRSGLPVAARDHGTLRRGLKLLRRHWLASGAVLMGMVAVAAFTLQTVRHADAMAREAQINRDAAAFIENVLRTAGPLQVLSDEVLENAAQRARVDLVDQHALRSRMLLMLAGLRLGRAEIQIAAEVAEEALQAARADADPTGWQPAALKLAELQNFTGELAGAEDLLREIIAAPATSSEKMRARARSLLGDVLHSRGAYTEALALVQQAALDSASDSAVDSVAYCALGMVLRDLARFDEARSALQRGMDLAAKHEGPDSVAISACLLHLGTLELQTGQIELARSALDRSAAIRTLTLGPDWAGMLWSNHWSALVRQARGDIDGADPLLTAAEENYRRQFGARSHLLSYAQSDLGWLRIAQGRDAEARALLVQAEENLDRLSAGRHPRLAEPWLGLATVAARSGDFGAAREFAQRALDIRQTSLPDMHPARLRACLALRHLGGTCDEQGSSPETSIEAIRLRPLLGLTPFARP